MDRVSKINTSKSAKKLLISAISPWRKRIEVGIQTDECSRQLAHDISSTKIAEKSSRVNPEFENTLHHASQINSKISRADTSSDKSQCETAVQYVKQQL